MKRSYTIGLGVGIFLLIAAILTTVALTVGTLNTGGQNNISYNATYFQYSTVISLQKQITAKFPQLVSSVSYTPFARQPSTTTGSVQDMINTLQQIANELGHSMQSPVSHTDAPKFGFVQKY